MGEIVILPMSELRLATNNFSEENLMKQTPSVVLYKGHFTDQSGQLIPIVVRRYANPDVSFNEARVSLFHIHKNIATLIKFASEELADDDGDFKELDDNTQRNVLSKGYLIYKYEVNESLNKHLSGSTLTWMQRLHICVDVARILSYIHYELDNDFSFIHGNIKSSKILLNQNWEPTLHGLRVDMAVKKHGVLHPSNYDGTLQYMDPAYEKSKALSIKSDVYSFGVVLFEVLLGRVASIQILDQDNWSFARFARSHYERKSLSDIIDPVLRQQMDSQSLKNFSETAYYCLEELRSQRPDMIQVVKKLERALDCQQKHKSPEHSTTAAVEAPPSEMDMVKDVILRMSELRLATNNFSEKNLLKQTPSVVLYKGQLAQSGQSIPIAVRRYTNPDVSFNEAMVSLFHIHKNISTLFKFASEELADPYYNTRMNVLSKSYLIYKYEVNESLDKHLSGSTLTWMQRLNICFDVARGLCCIHHKTLDYDDKSIIHGNIKSSKILLNQNWEPILHGLRLDMAVKKHGVHHPSNYDGTLQYTDPAYEKTKCLSHNSDVYSFGVVLFEVLLGRVASIPISDEDNWSFARFARSHYERKSLSDIIDPILRQQMDTQSLKIFSETAYYCLQELPSQRPDMIQVVKKLESALDFQQKHERLVRPLLTP